MNELYRDKKMKKPAKVEGMQSCVFYEKPSQELKKQKEAENIRLFGFTHPWA